MKTKIYFFLSVVFVSIMVVPILNVTYLKKPDTRHWVRKQFLFNMDAGSGLLAKILYPFGISIDPEQVIIGRDGWLYLGDQYEQTRSVSRRLPTESDVEIGKKIAASINAWNVYLSAKGVKLFKIMVGPNKGSIYSEHLPHWAKTAEPSAIDIFFDVVGKKHYIDLRPPLLEAKLEYQEPLYYKTDTHWNYIGAGLAFRYFSIQLGEVAPDLHWPDASVYGVARTLPRQGGDLAKFLRLTEVLADTEPYINALSVPLESTRYRFDTNEILFHGNNQRVEAPTEPVLIVSKMALNQKKVLWLRDSFGSAMSELMSLTFSEVLQLHWSEGMRPGGRFLELVEKWKPDYVFFTVVERSARNNVFTLYPPPLMVVASADFSQHETSSVVAINHLEKGLDDEYLINGNDPYVDFLISSPVDSADFAMLNLEITCLDGSSQVPVQLFWLQGDSPYFDEDHSAKFSFPTGNRLINLHTLPNWHDLHSVRRLRLDIDSVDYCKRFRLKNLRLGDTPVPE